ncbi:MAG TPA: hypothetical protein VD978_32360 [Azospirillum sp.]|nr:hypothetical protein [Azospirillum sp.]
MTEARRIIGGITGTPTGSIVLDQPLLAAEAPEPIREAATVPSAAPAGNRPDSRVLHCAKPNTLKGYRRSVAEGMPETVSGPAAADPIQIPVFHVAGADGVVGCLVIDRRAGRAGMVLVADATGVAEVNAAGLRIVRVEWRAAGRVLQARRPRLRAADTTAMRGRTRGGQDMFAGSRFKREGR